MRPPILYATLSRSFHFGDTQAAFETALDLTALLQSRLSAIVGELHIHVPNIWNSSTVSEIVEEEHKHSHESALLSAKHIETRSAARNLATNVKVVKGDFSSLRRIISGAARSFGLVVIEQVRESDFLSSTLIEPLLFESGRPVIIIPSTFTRKLALNNILVAWDGSASAARAVWDSIDLLQLARKVEILTISGEKTLPASATSSSLVSSLEFLGGNCHERTIAYDGASVAGLIHLRAQEFGADMVVQGGYGRSRWSEFVLGGVTREALLSGVIPTLMSHQG